LQIARPYDLFKNSDAHEVIYNFDNTDIKTYGDIKAEYQKGYNSFKESSEFFESDIRSAMSIDDFITTFSTLADALQWAYDYSDSPEGQSILTIMQQSKKTYSDLQDVINLYKDGVTKND
jgi:HKD family nuclease